MRKILSKAFYATSLVMLCNLLESCGGMGGPPKTSVIATKNPLVAQYSITASSAGQATVEFGTDTRYGRQTATYPLSAGGAINILVAGMKANSTYHMRAQLKGETSWTDEDHTFSTGALPSPPPKLTITRPNPSLSSMENPGIEMLSLIGVKPGPSNMLRALFTDRDANPIWYYDVGLSQGDVPTMMKLLPNGHIVLLMSNATAKTSWLREVDLAGNTIRELSAAQLNTALHSAGFNLVGQGFHHDFLPLDNGHWIVLTSVNQSFTNLPGYPGATVVVGDALVDVDQNFNPVWTWSAFDHLNVNRHLNGLPDWTHSNAVIYSASDGNLLLSMRNQAWILKIDYADGAGTGNVLWRLGNGGDFSLRGGDPAQWFYFQHFPTLISQPSGSQDVLGVWDNGNLRENADGTSCNQNLATACYSRATLFQLDESTRTATLQWQDLPGFFSFWGGSLNQLGNGNIEFDLCAPLVPPGQGVISEVQEVTPASSPQVVWKMDIGTLNAYRAYRIPSLYPGVTWKY
ncbi:MAG TPA: aryl-sulfate sulfotransferase [Terriglobales bacterium]|nr:aryl-sulfate sulfotransferase [Terriglobales bacterium]